MVFHSFHNWVELGSCNIKLNVSQQLAEFAQNQIAATSNTQGCRSMSHSAPTNWGDELNQMRCKGGPEWAWQMCHKIGIINQSQLSRIGCAGSGLANDFTSSSLRTVLNGTGSLHCCCCCGFAASSSGQIRQPCTIDHSSSQTISLLFSDDYSVSCCCCCYNFDQKIFGNLFCFSVSLCLPLAVCCVANKHINTTTMLLVAGAKRRRDGWSSSRNRILMSKQRLSL